MISKIIVTIALFATTLASLAYPATAVAAVDVASMQEAKVSFTFDDGFASTYDAALPILNAKGFKGTVYVTAGFVENGMTDDGLPAMNWTQVEALEDIYGWEIGGHTNTHPELPTISQAQIASELQLSNQAFLDHNLNVSNFASPFGAYDNVVLTEVLKSYASHRGFADRDALNTLPYNKSVIMVQDIMETTTPAQVQAWVDQAIANKQWLVLVMHHVGAKGQYEYTVTPADLTTMINYIASTGVKVETVAQVLTKTGANQTANYNFANGMANWSTDNISQVVLDTNNNGAYTNSANSVKMTGGATAAHLFSDMITAVPGAPYLLDVFYNAIGLEAGELGFFIDEYDANGTWISGQWLGNVTNGTIGYFQKFFDATSNLVSSFRVQTYLTAGSTGTAYVDNVDLHNLTATPSATPTITPTPSATPSGATNLIANATFDEGLGSGWTSSNPTTVALDTNNNGGQPTGQNSVRMTGSTTASHLFYGLLPVNPATSYLFSAFANATGLTSGELGFYMDEYDVNGTWISGQWFGMVSNGLTSTFNRVYKATSNLVSQVRVQTYLTANATGTAYVDNYSLTDQNGGTTPSVTPTPTVPAGSTSANMVNNATFDEGMTNGWTTNNATAITIDTNNNGEAPTGQNSASITGSSAASHLFYGLLPVNPATSYLFSAFANATGLTSGELGFYMDEYDVNGTWISGQWFGMVGNGISSTFTRVYKATSSIVSQVRIQTYITGGSTGTAYVDNYSLTDQSAGATTPTPTVTPAPSATPSATPTPTEPPVSGTNLVSNGSFEDVVSGFAANWERDTADFLIDTTSLGNAGSNSLHIGGNTAYAHAFSSRIAVNPTTTYNWSQYVSNLSGLGEFGFYIDEYDVNGNWISGQWKGMISGVFAGTQSYTYTPTSANVASVRLQYYVVPNSTFNLYIDSVSLSN